VHDDLDDSPLAPHPSSLIRFEVQDTGIGIDAETRPILFQPFTQADRSTTRRYGGTGLGLTICRRLVEQMGGEIGVESEPGRGSTFWFTVQVGVVRSAPTEAEPGVGAADQDEPVSPNGRPGPILVVDDSLINRLVTARMLAHLGYEVSCVESGALALQALERSSFSMILTDCYMPDLDGFALTAEVRGRDRRLPIVAMTADVLEETRRRCLESGMNDCVTKPLRIEQLQRVVQYWTAPRGADLAARR
jgi:CheY-like chemotaxis protein